MHDLLIVLDIDETLLHAADAPLERAPDAMIGPHFAYLRPHARTFLDSCLSRFRAVGIWTSSSADYASGAVDLLLGADRERLAFVWARERCTPHRDRDTQELVWTKNLGKLERRGHALERTVMVDDTPAKLARHYGNLVRVGPYLGDPADIELLELPDYLEALARVPNVRAVEKRGWRSRARGARPVTTPDVPFPAGEGRADERELVRRNRLAWEADAYRAWTARHGEPREAAARLVARPGHAVRRLLPHLGDPTGLDVANPLGSHGRVATSLALLGARVTVFDLSASNARWARELAAAAGVDLEYVVGDVGATAPACAGRFDAVVMELGVVHYFADLGRFLGTVRRLLRPGGRLVLNEFHPLERKALAVRPDGVALHGDYFAAGLEPAATPYGRFLDAAPPDCLVRRWTLGEIVTAVASRGLRVEALVEHPLAAAPRLPGTFTLVATADRAGT